MNCFIDTVFKGVKNNRVGSINNYAKVFRGKYGIKIRI